MKTVTYDEMLWKLVPVEPTKHMIDASALDDQMNSGSIRAAWKDMVEAAPLLASTPAPAQQEPSITAEFDVRKIMISVSPGEDGMGHEVYASSVADVENLLTSMGQELEEWRLGIRRYAAQHQEPPQQERKPMTYREIADATSEWAHVRSDYTIGIIRAAERHHGIKE